MPVMRMVRASVDTSPDDAGQGRPLPIIAATKGRKQDGIDLGDLPWDMSRGEGVGDRVRFPMLWAHDLAGRNLPIGVVDVGIGEDGTSLDNSEAVFDPDDDLAIKVERKYRSPVGGLAGFSITWEPVDADGLAARVSGKKPVANQLLEVSAVPVGLDPAAIKKTERMAMRSLRADLDALLGDSRALLPDDWRGAIEDLPESGMGWKTVTFVMANGPNVVTVVVGEREIPDGFPVPDWSQVEGVLFEEVEARSENSRPFGGDCEYATMEECMKAHADEDDPAAYCAELEKATGGKCAGDEEEEAERGCCGEIDDEDVVDVAVRLAGGTKEPPRDDPAQTAAAMVALFDRGSDDSDDDREKHYRALLPAYRRLGWEPPDFEPMANLRALDDENWRALFVAGELQRVGAELSTRNLREIQEIADACTAAGKRLRAMVERVSTGKDERDVSDDVLDHFARALETLQ